VRTSDIGIYIKKIKWWTNNVCRYMHSIIYVRRLIFYLRDGGAVLLLLFCTVRWLMPPDVPQPVRLIVLTLL
jgi:hypothetical protein